MSSAAQEAWADTFFATLPQDVSQQLLVGSWERSLAAGQIFYRGAHHADMVMLGVVVQGMLRIFRRSVSGRQVTIRYAGPGDVIGVPAVLLGGTEIDGEVVSDAVVLHLSPARFQRVAQHDARVGWLVAQFLAGQVAASEEILSADLFMEVRARVARHLLDLATRDQNHLTVVANHQQIADAIGSVREVVSRTIKRMQDEGIVERDAARMILRDPAALHTISTGHEPLRGPGTVLGS